MIWGDLSSACTHYKHIRRTIAQPYESESVDGIQIFVFNYIDKTFSTTIVKSLRNAIVPKALQSIIDILIVSEIFYGTVKHFINLVSLAW